MSYKIYKLTPEGEDIARQAIIKALPQLLAGAACFILPPTRDGSNATVSWCDGSEACH